MNILGKNGVYGKSQATLVLKEFFTQKPSSGFKFTFKGKESNEGSFAIGNYNAKDGEYRVTVHFKKCGDQYLIETLNIEK